MMDFEIGYGGIIEGNRATRLGRLKNSTEIRGRLVAEKG